MENVLFKTNIKCGGCVATVTPHLDEAIGAGNWSVDTNDPGKLLSVKDAALAEKAQQAVQKAGFKIEKA
ncbi:heavy metal transport/detoxification protein [Cytophagales bacterium LB-30]|uniref:Heavy metal transport/detoxification protein n=1 Tax=Shiella aurantiaca TaxID=3058365 RepID=A0ABT8F3A9_9BACT|nr:heavy metal transport/detoxification protein [Shiella aurantiaca]MDN4164793.1 heavy metal transport/detoxification protein [Shiella aurantiaca]